jgi:hypothetical protein
VAGAVGVESSAVGVVACGDGEAGGRGSCEEQSEEIRGRTAKMKVIHRLVNIDVPFKGFDQEPNCSEDCTAAFYERAGVMEDN